MIVVPLATRRRIIVNPHVPYTRSGEEGRVQCSIIAEKKFHDRIRASYLPFVNFRPLKARTQRQICTGLN